jgi:uncharacterized membrane protein YfcA
MGIAIACTIDISRLSMYATQLSSTGTLPWKLVAVATTSAFAGAWLGNRWLKKYNAGIPKDSCSIHPDVRLLTHIGNCINV